MPSIQYKIFANIITFLPINLRLRLLYFRRFKEISNFKKPTTFNEKVQYSKLHNRNCLLTIAADKLASKKFVSSICPNIYIPRIIWEGDSVKSINDILLHELPESYVFKANHTSQTLRIIHDGNHIQLDEMKTIASKWLRHDQASVLGEWAYKNIPRKIFIEEFLDFEGSAPDDYKFFVYHGKVHFIQLDSDRFMGHKRNMFDREWSELNFEYSHPQKQPVPLKPLFLDAMISISEKIGSHFDFIRVDLYFYNNKVTFGELTVYPGAGFEKFPDKKFDFLFGLPWDQNYNNN